VGEDGLFYAHVPLFAGLSVYTADGKEGTANEGVIAKLLEAGALLARGKLVREDELTAELVRGTIAGAALDVFEHEPLAASSPLWDLPNVYVSAHSSVSVDRYLDDVFDLFLDNAARYLRGEELRNRVDMAVLGFR